MKMQLTKLQMTSLAFNPTYCKLSDIDNEDHISYLSAGKLCDARLFLTFAL